MTELIFLLTVLIALGNLADFLIGSRGQRKVKDKLISWYVSVSNNDWSQVVRSAAGFAQNFFDNRLGEKTLSLRFIARGSLLSFTASGALLTIAYSIQQHSFIGGLRFLTLPGYRTMAIWVIVLNCILDLTSLSLVRHLLKWAVATKSRLTIGGLLLLNVVVAYLATVLAVLVTAPASFTALMYGIILTERPFWPPIKFWTALIFANIPDAFRTPWNADVSIGGVNISVFAIGAAFGTWLQLLVLLVAWCIWLSRPVTQRPLTILLDRLEDSPKGLFTIIGVFLAAVIGLMTAYQKM